MAEDAPKYADDGGTALFADFHAAGLTVDRVTVHFDETKPDVIQERAFLDRLVPAAKAAGIQLVFQLVPVHPRAFQTDTTDDFAAYAARVARAYPTVRRFIVLNEPNESYFLAPSSQAGKNVSAAVANEALAKAYDALKGVDPDIDVIGLALSPEANDVTSTSPVRFLAALGRAYRQSGRTKPLMDDLALHLYPKNAATQGRRHPLPVAADRPERPRADQAGVLRRVRRHRAARVPGDGAAGRPGRPPDARRDRLAGRAEAVAAPPLHRAGEHAGDDRAAPVADLRVARPVAALRPGGRRHPPLPPDRRAESAPLPERPRARGREPQAILRRGRDPLGAGVHRGAVAALERRRGPARPRARACGSRTAASRSPDGRGGRGRDVSLLRDGETLARRRSRCPRTTARRSS